MRWIALQFGLPKSRNGVAAFSQVGILRLIKGSPSLLSGIEMWVFSRVPMPVITVKLNNDLIGGNDGINAKLAVDYLLTQILNPKLVKQGIAKYFQFVRTKSRLLCVHLDQHGMAFGVCISALKRAVCNIVRLYTRRRPLKGTTTNLANVFGLIAALIFIGMGSATEKGLILAKPTRWYIYGLLTSRTVPMLASFSIRSRRYGKTFVRTKLLAWPKPFDDLAPTSLTGNCSGFIARSHGLIIAQKGLLLRGLI